MLVVMIRATIKKLVACLSDRLAERDPGDFNATERNLHFALNFSFVTNSSGGEPVWTRPN